MSNIRPFHAVCWYYLCWGDHARCSKEDHRSFYHASSEAMPCAQISYASSSSCNHCKWARYIALWIEELCPKGNPTPISGWKPFRISQNSYVFWWFRSLIFALKFAQVTSLRYAYANTAYIHELLTYCTNLFGCCMHACTSKLPCCRLRFRLHRWKGQLFFLMFVIGYMQATCDLRVCKTRSYHDGLYYFVACTQLTFCLLHVFERCRTSRLKIITQRSYSSPIYLVMRDDIKFDNYFCHDWKHSRQQVSRDNCDNGPGVQQSNGRQTRAVLQVRVTQSSSMLCVSTQMITTLFRQQDSVLLRWLTEFERLLEKLMVTLEWMSGQRLDRCICNDMWDYIMWNFVISDWQWTMKSLIALLKYA